MPYNIEVKTKIQHSLCHSLSPPQVQTSLSPTSFTLTNLNSIDLAISIISKQVHELSKTVQLFDRSTTILPCIIKDRTYILHDDADAVAFFMSLPESKPQTLTHVIHLHYSN